VQLGWGLAVPGLILGGAADAWLGTDSTLVRSLVGDGTSVVAAVVPPGLVGTMPGTRLLVVFAFLQTMHLLVWVAFFPRNAPDAAADLEERLPWVTGAGVWAIGFLAAAVFAVVLVSSYSTGVLVHDALTIPHVYVELPLLLALTGRRRAVAQMSDVDPGPRFDERADDGPDDERADEARPVPETSLNPLAHAAGGTYGLTRQ
jgi:hypothetical protein